MIKSAVITIDSSWKLHQVWLLPLAISTTQPWFIYEVARYKSQVHYQRTHGLRPTVHQLIDSTTYHYILQTRDVSVGSCANLRKIRSLSWSVEFLVIILHLLQTSNSLSCLDSIEVRQNPCLFSRISSWLTMPTICSKSIVPR